MSQTIRQRAALKSARRVFCDKDLKPGRGAPMVLRLSPAPEAQRSIAADEPIGLGTMLRITLWAVVLAAPLAAKFFLDSGALR